MRRACTLAMTAAFLAAGCEREPTPEERALADARDIAMVEAANQVMPPVQQVTPEPIMLPDIERYDLYGQACNYAPGTSFGTRVVAREADAFVKVKGEVHRLAADPGSRELPMRTRTLYNGKKYSLRLAMEQDGEAEEGQPANYEGAVTLRDEYGRVVYEGVGLAQCKA